MKISDKCRTRYPILLVHGCGFRDSRLFCYWGRIPRILEKQGARIFYAFQDGWATVETNAQVLMRRVNEVLAQTGAEKVNLIAHSKGGLECRYMISSLGMADKVASLTTVSTPHHGSQTVELLNRFPKPLFNFAGFFVNGWNRILGDKKPDFAQTCYEFSKSYSERFNRENPDAPQVYYQSYATKMNNIFSDIFLAVPFTVVSLIDGPCDGLVSVNSAQWTNFRGIACSAGHRGISHADSVDMRRHRLSRKRCDGAVSDITDFYTDITAGLAASGF